MNRFSTLLALATFLTPIFAVPQSGPTEAKAAPAASKSTDDEPHEMLFTAGGLLAFDTPKGWEHSDGPGLASFVPTGSDPRTSAAMIYISGAPIGPEETEKSLRDYVQSDVLGFKRRFKNGIVHQEKSISLPTSKVDIPVYTFKSGEKHNAFEQVAYIQDTDRRVLTVVLSAKTEAAFNQSLAAFQSFVKSFRGSIILAPKQ